MATITKSSHHEFDDVLVAFDDSLPPAVTQALRSLLAALEYEDRPLIRSHLETMRTVLVEAIDESFKRIISASQLVRQFYRRRAGILGGSPSEKFDASGRATDALLGNVLQTLTEWRDHKLREVQQVGVQPTCISDLHAEIAEMEAFRSSLIGTWSWSSNSLPASDKAMLARARASSLRGEAVPIEDLIRQAEAAK